MADKLKKIRCEFIKRVSLPVVMDLLDDLLHDEVLNDGEKDAVIDKTSKRDKARCLIDTVRGKGNKPANTLIAHLEKRDRTVFSELGLSSPAAQTVSQDKTSKIDKARCLIDILKGKGNKPANTLIAHLEKRDRTLFSELGLSSSEQPAIQTALPQVSQDAMDSETSPMDTEPSQNAKSCEMPLELILSTDVFKKDKLNDPGIYPMHEKSSRNRLALLVTNLEFDYLNKRNGAEKDEENMLLLLNGLGYDVEKHRDLSGKEMDSAVKRFSQDTRLNGTDSVFVVIMSHGKLGVIKGVKWTPWNEDVFQIENLYTHLNTKNCPALLNKPKVIIIQACRGEVDGSAMVHDGDIASDAYLDTEGIEDDGSFRAHIEKDFISLLSSTPHTLSYRHHETGSFLIKYIFEIFLKSAHKDHIVDLFMQVRQSFLNCPFEKIRQMPTTDRCTMTRHFYLFPGY